MNLIERIVTLEKTVERLVKRTFILYEKSTFSPVLAGSGTAGTFTYGSGNLVEWTRIGNRVFFNGRVSITATSVAPTLNMSISGWPYAGVADTNMAIAGVCAVIYRNITLPAGYLSVALQFANGSSAAVLVRSGTGVNLATVQGAELGGGVYDFRFGGHYRVA